MTAFELHDNDERSFQLLQGEKKLTIYSGDLLSLEADAYVCPVDPMLTTSQGLAQIFVQKAGKNSQPPSPVYAEPYGKVIVMPGGKLPAKYLFYTVLLGERGLDKLKLSISQAVDRTIRYAEFLRLKSLAFPVLGSAEIAPPYSVVAHAMLESVIRYFQRRNTKIKALLFSSYNSSAYQALKQEARDLTDL